MDFSPDLIFSMRFWRSSKVMAELRNVAQETPCFCSRLKTWSSIRAISGETTRVTAPRESARRMAGSWNSRDFPAPVGAVMNRLR